MAEHVTLLPGRYRAWLSAAVLAVSMAFGTAAAAKDWPLWTAADSLGRNGDLSFARIGSFGNGAYPYERMMPGSMFRVRVDGVPMRSLSPFGPDLDRIPAEYIGSVSHGGTDIDITTGGVGGKLPVTRMQFGQGARKRFQYHVLLSRPVGETGRLIAGGTSKGIHGNDTILASMFRSYIVGYRKMRGDGGSTFLTLQAYRDRDNIPDIIAETPMGRRESDDVSISAGVRRMVIGDGLALSSRAYYSSDISRVKRYGAANHIDDDMAGGALEIAFDRGNTAFTVKAVHDSRIFDSRIHDEKWKRHDTGIFVSGVVDNERLRVAFSGGTVLSSKFGAAPSVEGELRFPVSRGMSLGLSGRYIESHPDPGVEYYPSLVFSDSSIVADIDSYSMTEAVCDVAAGKGSYSFAVEGFVARLARPYFDPAETICRMGRTASYSGGRIRSRWSNSEIGSVGLSSSFRRPLDSGWDKEDDIRLWPYPVFDIGVDGELRRTIYRGLLTVGVFGDARYCAWPGDAAEPGRSLLIDGGVTVVIGSMTLFYRMENIAGQETMWFDTFGNQGRNGMWGIQWELTD